MTSQSQEVFRRVKKQLYAGDCRASVSFRRPFIPNTFFASMLPRTGWVGGGQNWVCPGARETLGTSLQWWPINPNDIHSATLTLCTCAKYIGEQSLFGNALLGLKTRLRSTMSQGWLNNVVACHTQRERLKLLKSEKNVEKFVAVSEHRRQVFRYF